MLRNIIYQDELEYYPIEQCDDAEDLIQNSFVSNILYIGEHNKTQEDSEKTRISINPDGEDN